MNITAEQLKEIIKDSITPMLEAKESKLTLTIAEAASLSGIGREKLTELVYRGEVPHFKIGAKTLINKEMFVRWLEKISQQNKAL